MESTIGNFRAHSISKLYADFELWQEDYLQLWEAYDDICRRIVDIDQSLILTNAFYAFYDEDHTDMLNWKMKKLITEKREAQNDLYMKKMDIYTNETYLRNRGYPIEIDWNNIMYSTVKEYFKQ